MSITPLVIKRDLCMFLLILGSVSLAGCMSIHQAAEAGNVDEVRKQLTSGINPNSRTLWYRVTPLHRAAAYGRVRIVKLLLENGAEVNIRNEGGETPLHYAARHGHVSVMKILLEYGADPAQKGTGCGTPMQWAAGNGQIRAIKTLLDYGVGIDQPGSGGVTALMEAVSHSQLETVRFLLANDANVNVRDNNGSTALFRAPNAEIGRILRENGADTEVETDDGRRIPRSLIEQINGTEEGML